MTSTGLFGRVGEFIAERETFNSYVERMEMFFSANNIVETTGEGSNQANRVVAKRKRAIFLTEVGAEVYSTLNIIYWRPLSPKLNHSLMGVCKKRTGYLRMADADGKMRIEKCG